MLTQYSFAEASAHARLIGAYKPLRTDPLVSIAAGGRRLTTVRTLLRSAIIRASSLFFSLGTALMIALLPAVPNSAFASVAGSQVKVSADEGDRPDEQVLSLGEVVNRAREDQPAIAAFEQEAAASEQAAVARRSLPDPQLSVGVQNYPVTGGMALDPSRDDMTMYTLGIMREQVRRSRREAEAARLKADAVISRAEGSTQQRRIQRDVMIAWIDAVEAIARQRLLRRVINELEAGRAVMEAGVPTGMSNPALALQAQAEIALAQVQLDEAHSAEARARAMLTRWIGPAAQRPLPGSLPRIALPPNSAGEVDIDTHPQIRLAEAQEQSAQRQVEVARLERRPNITWSVMYGWRPEYGDMVSAQVSIPLQRNRSHLQNRRITEAQQRAEAARLRAEDSRRELDGAFRSALANYRSAEAQLRILLEQAIPSLEGSFEAAEASYAGGQGSLELPLNIVRRYIEANIQALEQQGRLARAAAELIYLTGEPAQ